MRQFAERVLRRIRGFRRNERGTAIVEFALVVPFLLILYMGTIEISDLIAVDRRINVISGTVGDLIAREDGCIDAATITEYFKASEGIITPYSKTGVKQVATLLTVSSGGVATVTWSQAYNGGTAKTLNSVYALPTAMVDISKGQWVVMSETYYSYKPLLGWVVSSAVNLHRTSYYMPREGTTIAYTSGTCA